MNRYLTLLRHSYAMDGLSGIKDFDRELTDKGFTAAIRMGKRLKQESKNFDAIYSSTAKRAVQTTELIAEQLIYDKEQVVHDEELYNLSLGGLLKFVQSIPDEKKEVLVIGHNPTFSYFVEMVANQTGFMMQPCAAVTLMFESTSWMLVDSATAEIFWQSTPVDGQ